MRPSRRGVAEGPVGVLLPALQGGGLDRAMISVARGLGERGHDVRLLPTMPMGATAGDVRDVPVQVLDARRIRHQVPALRRWMRDHAPSVLHATMPPLFLGAWLATRGRRPRPRVTSSMHVMVGADRFTAPGLTGPVVRRAFTRAYRSNDGLVAVSTGLARRSERMLELPTGTIGVIPSAVMDRVRFVPGGRAPHPWLGPDRPTIVTVGRLAEQKQQRDLLDALALVHREVPDARLLMIGEGPDRADLEARVRALGLEEHVQLLGHREDRLEFVHHARVFALSSIREGLAGAVIEALAVGTPVVSTDAPDGPFDVLAGGRYGDLVPMSDPAALAAAIGARLRDPVRPELGDHLRQYELDPVLDQWEALWGLRVS